MCGVDLPAGYSRGRNAWVRSLETLAVKEGHGDASLSARLEEAHSGEQFQARGTPDDERALRNSGLAIARWWLKARRLREETFGPGLFADPAWDILLDLYTSAARGESVQISSLAFAARVPHSTAIRWAKIMTKAGIVVREKDPRDARRVHVSLSAAATALMEKYLAQLSQDGQVPSAILSGP